MLFLPNNAKNASYLVRNKGKNERRSEICAVFVGTLLLLLSGFAFPRRKHFLPLLKQSRTGGENIEEWVISLFCVVKNGPPKSWWVGRFHSPSSEARYCYSYVGFASGMCLFPCSLAHVQDQVVQINACKTHGLCNLSWNMAETACVPNVSGWALCF